MIKRLNIGNLNVCLVLRHRFEEKHPFNPTFSRLELGMWFKKSKIVGKRNFKTPAKWNYVNSYMLGINLLLCKTWIEIDVGGMHMDIELD